MYWFLLLSLSWHSLLRSYSDSKFLVWTCSAPVVCEGKGREVRAVGEIYPVGRRDLTGSGTVWGSGPHLRHILLIFSHKATQAPPLSAPSFWQSTSGSLQSFWLLLASFVLYFVCANPALDNPFSWVGWWVQRHSAVTPCCRPWCQAFPWLLPSEGKTLKVQTSRVCSCLLRLASLPQGFYEMLMADLINLTCCPTW